MENHGKNSDQENLHLEQMKNEEAKSLAKDQLRKAAYLAREQEIEKGQKIKETQRAESRTREEAQEAEKEKVRKEAYLAREKKIAEDQEARKLKNKTS